MGYWYSPAGDYNEGDPLFADSVAVPRRPDGTHVWNGNTWAATADTAAEQAEALYSAAIAAGIVIASTSTPALNGTYALGPSDTANIGDEAQFITIFSEFTNGATAAMTWADASGATHSFSSTSQFMAFAKAVAQYVSALKMTLATLRSGGTAAWPSNQAAIP
jgi:hypothetical protein